jgi:hypothetical protein
MRSFAIWAAVSAALLAGGLLASRSMLSDHPALVLVAIDASHSMSGDWNAAANIVDRLAARPFTKHSIVSEKGPVEGDGRSIRNIRPYAPRDLERLAAIVGKRTGETEEKILITNAATDEIPEALRDWTILRP